MNKTSIEWCHYTWNPVSGCRHACREQYCYNTQKASSPLPRFGARYFDENGILQREPDWRSRETGGCHVAAQGEIYPWGYDCTYYPHRLAEPGKVRQPSRIFVSDTGDLFGRWVPEAWIGEVLAVATECSWHTLIFLTKNPKRYREFTFPSNAWVGTSVTSDRDRKRIQIIREVRAAVRFLSIEPLLGPVTAPLDGLEWIIVGRQTGTYAPPPERRWVEAILARAQGIPVFVKGNLASIYPDLARKDYPRSP